MLHCQFLAFDEHEVDLFDGSFFDGGSFLCCCLLLSSVVLLFVTACIVLVPGTALMTPYARDFFPIITLPSQAKPVE